jgi:hypothetical protein
MTEKRPHGRHERSRLGHAVHADGYVIWFERTPWIVGVDAVTDERVCFLRVNALWYAFTAKDRYGVGGTPREALKRGGGIPGPGESGDDQEDLRWYLENAPEILSLEFQTLAQARRALCHE